MTLGSLFDGSGGFPLAGALCGIEPVWASEIEPFPIKVTSKRFPNMKHLGSVIDVNGAEVEPVDIITFGSPCQDLSIAGKQAGIHDGKRSSLFFEAIRVIREMRNATSDYYPRFAVFENVPGIFSSNKGEDFRAVIQAFCSIWGVQDHIVPLPPKGKWLPSGCVVGNGASLAWRVYDAQYWGVPQRRKRVYLIADFRGERAGEILFESESMSGDSEQSREAWQGIAFNTTGSTGRSTQVCAIDSHPMDSRFKLTGDIVPCLTRKISKGSADAPLIVQTCYPIENHPHDCRVTLNEPEDPVQTLNARMGTGGGNVPMILMKAESETVLCIGNGQANQSVGSVSGALNCMHDQQAILIKGKPPRKYILRRLTPTECARLQGFPDWWCDGVDGSDSAKYRLWGNGIALPCAYDVIRRLAKELEGDD